jgi:outer membrane protein assembly factor BamB
VSETVHRAAVQYPGGFRGLYRWAGTGEGPAVFALSEAGGTLTDHGDRAGPGFEGLCRAELRLEGPTGPWTARFASAIFDEPRGLLWDTPGLLVVTYGFLTYGLVARTGELRWMHRSATPIVAAFGSSRLDHVVVQTELETFALDEGGTARWRVAHSDVVAEAELLGGRLVLRSYEGLLTSLDPATGRPAA